LDSLYQTILSHWVRLKHSQM